MVSNLKLCKIYKIFHIKIKNEIELYKRNVDFWWKNMYNINMSELQEKNGTITEKSWIGWKLQIYVKDIDIVGLKTTMSILFSEKNDRYCPFQKI